MQDSLETRVKVLEIGAVEQRNETNALKDNSAALRKSLEGIEKTLSQIKWLATGAVLATVGKSIGFETIFKMFL